MDSQNLMTLSISVCSLPEHQITQVVEKRLSGEFAGIGDFQHPFLTEQERHPVLLSTLHGMRIEARVNLNGIQPKAC